MPDKTTLSPTDQKILAIIQSQETILEPEIVKQLQKKRGLKNINSARATVSRAIKKLKEAGKITLAGRQPVEDKEWMNKNVWKASV